MNIAYITAGAAGMYCGTCLHDNTLAACLLRRGHEATLIPMYTPIRTDEQDVSVDRVFYGAINVYLEQKSALFRHTPWLLDRLFNGRRLLQWASGRGASVEGRDLGDMTLSVLQGESGHQAKELEKLVAFLRDELKPEIVHLSNSMFLGMARRIREEVGVPVVCSLQGEDIFLEEIPEPYYSDVHRELMQRARDVDAFVSPSEYYRDHMAEYLDVSPERIRKIPLGVSLEGYDRDRPSASLRMGLAHEDRPFSIAYMARICPEKGLHLLVDAFRRLVEAEGQEQARLSIAGYLGPRDQAYLDGIMQQIRSWQLDDHVDLLGEVDRKAKIELLRSSHVLSVPTTYREPKGLFVLEALAAGTPVVLPRHGAFPELVKSTGGGQLFEPESAEALCAALRELMHAPDRCRQLAERGREVVWRDYNDEVMADATLSLYDSLTSEQGMEAAR